MTGYRTDAHTSLLTADMVGKSRASPWVAEFISTCIVSQSIEQKIGLMDMLEYATANQATILVFRTDPLLKNLAGAHKPVLNGWSVPKPPWTLSNCSLKEIAAISRCKSNGSAAHLNRTFWSLVFDSFLSSYNDWTEIASSDKFWNQEFKEFM